jgi:predicted 3-demethylubiquinone-9 3-methyltransferase (glyoxalase superfamily)
MNNTIYPCFWFDGQAQVAAEFYCSVFANSKITVDTPMVVNFSLNRQKFMGLNGGPEFKINPCISIFAMCETENETDEVWQKLSNGGKVMMPLDKYPWSEKYGWLQDKFGVSWQIAQGKLDDVHGQKFTPCLLFTGPQHGRAEEAINFYTSVFQPSSVSGILHYQAGETQKEGTVQHAQFIINNYVLMVMDSEGHAFNFNEAFSFVIDCDTQQEIDYYWTKFSEGGEESMCGWVKDKFGVWWQVVPAILGKLMSDPSRAQKVMQAFLKMKKFDIKKLEEA